MTDTKPLGHDLLDRCTADDLLRRSTLPDEVLRRAELLPQPERDLVRLVLSGAATQRQVAEARNLNAGSLCRQIRRLEQRLMGAVAKALAERGHELTDHFRHLAIQHFLLGKPAYALARQMSLPKGHIEAILSFVQGWASK